MITPARHLSCAPRQYRLLPLVSHSIRPFSLPATVLTPYSICVSSLSYTRLVSSKSRTSPSSISKSAASSQKRPPVISRTSPVPIDSVSSDVYAYRLATRTHPTLIYESPSHALMFASYWTGAAMMVVSMSVPALLVLSGPSSAGLAYWVIPAYQGIVAASFFIAAGIVYAGAGTIHKITALSSAPIVSSTSPNKGRPAYSNNASITKLWLEFEVKRAIPILPYYKIKAPLNRVTMEPGALAALLAIPQAQWDLLRRETDRISELEAQYDRDHPASRPWRHFWRSVAEFWRKVAYAVSRREFSQMRVYEKRLQIHATAGWALEDGAALEKLFGGERFLRE